MKSKSLTSKHAVPEWDLVLRVAASSSLSSSPRLCDLLLYVTDCVLRESPEEVTEQRIGTKVFGRPATFNPAEDSIVRSQARLLRIKMAAYFAGEGASEAMTVAIPKGHYLPVFQEATHEAAPALLVSLPVAEAPRELLEELGDLKSPAQPKSHGRRDAPARWSFAALLAILAIAVLCAGGFWLHAKLSPSPTLVLWHPFLKGDPPLVIYSNALFEGDSKTGLRYAPSDTPLERPIAPHLVDTYTGVGELASVYVLTRLFDSQDARFTLKRSLLVTWDEAKLRNLIFIGAASENGSIRVLPATSDFTMMSTNDVAGIVNNHPRKGEPLLLTRPEYPLTRDYAILALLPGLEPGHFTFVLSGLTTMGTQAAVEFSCRKEGVAELLRRIGYTSGEVRPFEAVLEVSVGGGVPLQSHIVMVHAH